MNRKSHNEQEFLSKRLQKNRFSLEEEMSLQSLEYPTNIHTYMNERLLADKQEND